MKNSVFASLFVEAINNANEENGMVSTISNMLNQIEQKEIARRSNKKAGQLEGKPSASRSLHLKNSHHPKKNNLTSNNENALSVFSRELKQKKYREIVSERPYYFLSLESLIEKKSEAKITLDRMRNKYSGISHHARIRQAETKYYQVMAEIEREIQLKVRERLQQGKKIPRSLLVNDGYVLSEEGVKRDERRKQLIAEEAQAAMALREAITKVTTHTKLTPQQAEIQVQSKQFTPPQTTHTLQVPVTKVSGNFDRELYFELLKGMSRDEAWRIVKSKTQNAPFETGELCYFHTLCYWLQINAGCDQSTALNVASDSDKAENYLRNTIADLTTNKINKGKAPYIKLKAALASSKIESVKFTRLRHFNIIDTNRYHHSITSRSAVMQANFKMRVLYNFYQRCAVTGQKIEAFLQACHIEKYAIGGCMSTDNGILLSADCHRLFDANLMGIEPEKLTVHFKVPCIYSSMFEGKCIYPHRLALDKKKLRKKWEQFQEI